MTILAPPPITRRPSAWPEGDVDELDAEVPQHLRALARANRVREVRAIWKRNVSAVGGFSGALLIAAALERTPDELGGMAIADAIAAQHRWGPQRTGALLDQLGISERWTLGTLTRRQVIALTRALLEPYSRERG